MKFIIDEQLPPALARWLRSKGHEADHVADLDMLGRSDLDIARHGLETSSVIVTKDEDYLNFRPAVGPVQVLWLRVGNVANPVLRAWMEAAWPDALRRLEAGAEIVEVWPPATPTTTP